MKGAIAATVCFGSLILATVPTASAALTPLEELGKLLFFDDNLSTPPGQSCATCHDPATAFAGPDAGINAGGAVYPGAVHVRFGNRKPPSAAYATFSPDFHYDEEEGLYVGGNFWDGRALDAVEQAKGPFLNPVEQNNPNAKHVITKIAHSDYAVLFQEVYGWGALHDIDVAYQQVAEAIAAYEASIEVSAFSSKYDAYLAGNADLSPEELRGLFLFEGQGQCSACHPSQPGEDGTPPLFTDFTYDNLGVPRNLQNPWYGMPPSYNRDGDGWIDYGLGGRLSLQEELGKFKVPTLRNVAMRPDPSFVQAYMHNGVFKSLHEVIDFYNTRDVADWPEPEVPINVNSDELGDLGLSPADVDDIVAFLGTLADGWQPQPLGPGHERMVAWHDVSPAPSAEVVAIGPNPFVERATFQIQVDAPVALRCELFDASGRLVKTLGTDGVVMPGLHAWSWDGRDEDGHPVPTGSYLYRIDGPNVRDSGRLIRIR